MEHEPEILERWSQSPLLSPELRAGLACAESVAGCALQGDLAAALKACSSTEKLCSALLGHGMLGHLHSVLSTGSVPVDTALVERVAELQRVIELRNLRQTATLLRLLGALDAAGVRALALKGPVWAQALYGDIARRSWTDLDLLVRPKDVALTRRLLLARGFSETTASNELMLRRGHSGGEMGLHHREQGVSVDLHWQVTTGVSPRPLTADVVFAHLHELDLLGRRVLCPTPPLLLAIACLEGAKDGWPRVENLLGVVVAARTLSAEDWSTLSDVAGEVKCRRRVVLGIKHAHAVLGLVAPMNATLSLRGWPAIRGVPVSLARARLIGDGSLARDHLALLLWRVATEDNVWDGMRHLGRTMFEPGPGDWQSLTLPDWAGWLYWFVRPARLFSRLGRGLLSGARRRWNR